jgi:coenzyme F420-0:L-glutamate ligase/coenzyme F420-1:gamma-L-glutamate ligase
VSGAVVVLAPDGVGEVAPGVGLAALADALHPALAGAAWPGGGRGLADGDVLVVASKVVSKAEGRVVAAADRERAITDQTVRVVATREHARGVTRIVENPQGLVMAAAGVDSSNTPRGTVLLLPEDPDRSARELRALVRARTGANVAVVLSDTVGRPWRLGVADVAVGVAGLAPLQDLRGVRDAHGTELAMTVVALADEVAAAGDLVKGKTAGRPVAVVRGLAHLVAADDGPGAAAARRPAAEDMFRLGTDEARAQGYAEGYRAGRAATGGAGATP